MVCEQVREAVRHGGLLADAPILVMISGGRDSTCLLDVAVALRGPAQVSALHVNYGLRELAGADERHCVALCEGLGVTLEVVHAGAAAAAGPSAAEASSSATDAVAAAAQAGAGGAPAAGNLQAWAREVRYGAGERIAEPAGALLAAAHTADDQVETILYRLAASPGRRALLGMAAREGRLVRPLLAITRAQTSAYCEERGLRWRDDESNADQRFARTRVRSGLLPALRALHPAAQSNVLRTALLLREETELLDGLVAAELGERAAVEIERLRRLPGALARLVVVRLAEQAAGSYVPQAGDRVQEILALAARGGRAELHVGGQVGAVIEDGVLRMVALAPRRRSVPAAGH